MPTARRRTLLNQSDFEFNSKTISACEKDLQILISSKTFSVSEKGVGALENVFLSRFPNAQVSSLLFLPSFFLSFSLQGGPLALALLRLGPLFSLCF